MNKDVTIYNGDALKILKTLESETVQTCVTSPPYWGLRDYQTAEWEGGDKTCNHSVGSQVEDNKYIGAITTGQRPGVDASVCIKCGAVRVDKQLGLEKTPEEYVAKMVEIFHEVKRVLKNDGTLWLNLGDSYNGSGGEHKRDKGQNGLTNNRDKVGFVPPKNISSLKPKDLVGIPWRVALALQEDGWYLRSDIIWRKLNPMPESVKDRPTKGHEYMFLLSKSKKYFYDIEAIKEPAVYPYDNRGARKDSRRGTECNSMSGKTGGYRNKRSVWEVEDHEALLKWLLVEHPEIASDFINSDKSDVWSIATKPYKGAHFATFPPALITPCIKAGTSEKGCCPECGAPWVRIVDKVKSVSTSCPKEQASHEARGGTGSHTGTVGKSGGGRINGYTSTIGWKPTCNHDIDPVPCVVLDPFGGSMTTACVSKELGRKSIMIELNDKYIDLGKDRIEKVMNKIEEEQAKINKSWKEFF